MSDACVSALSKGLSFAPTAHTNDFETIIDFQKFFRNLRLREFFHSDQGVSPSTTVSTTDDTRSRENSAPMLPATTRFKKKSMFTPPKHRNSSLETYCRLVDNDVKTLLKKKKEYKVFNNLSKEERNAIMDLKKDNKIVVRSADKGGAVVLQNAVDYEMEISRQLNDLTFYEKLPSDPTYRLQARINSQLSHHLHNEEFDKNVFDFLITEHPVVPVFYTLPKVHKGLETPIKGRPIVSCIGSLTENISAYVDHFIKPMVTTLPSYIRDSVDLINSLKSFNNLSDNTLLATFDVQSLYTNIPHDGGINALHHFLSLHHSENKPSIDCVLDLANIVLNNNAFRFQSDFYLQKKGTAMGSKMAPNYACLYMGLFEHQYVLNSTNPFYSKIIFYKRFVDDIFTIMECTVDELKCFHEYLNSCNEHLQFTLEHHAQRISFLDVLVYRDGLSLKTDLFRKATDRNTILHGDSFHPKQLIKSLPISQFHRVRRICSDASTYSAQSSDMAKRFLNRGYKHTWVDAAMTRFDHTTQEECLKPKQRTSGNTKPSTRCCVRYSPLAHEFKKVIHKHWHIVQTDPRLQNVFTTAPQFVFKRAPNLKDCLVRSDTCPPPTKPLLSLPDGNYKCGGCAQCSFTHKCKHFSHPHTGKSLPIRGAITCSTTHVVYLIRCPCGLAYVGKTTRELRTRISEHRSTIRTGDEKSPVAAHFKSAGHNVSALRYIGVERVDRSPRGGDRGKRLLQRETFWIHYLNTMSPNGLNEEFDIKPFL